MNKYISELRKKLGLSLVAFSKPLKCSPTQIKRMEIGTVIPNEDFIKRICQVYNVDPQYFEGIIDLDFAVPIKDPEIEKKQVGQRLNEIRKEKNMTLVELAKEIHFSESQLSFIENGEGRLTQRRANDIADVFEVGVDWILYGDEEKKENPINKKVIDWLWSHPEYREDIWSRIHNEFED